MGDSTDSGFDSFDGADSGFDSFDSGFDSFDGVDSGGFDSFGDGGFDVAADVSVDINADVSIDTSCDVSHSFEHPYDTSHINDIAGLRLFTVQGIISFMVIFGWTGVITHGLDWGLQFSLILAASLGFLSLFFIAKLFQWSVKLQSAGNIRMRDALGVEGNVYIPIPPKGTGTGKVVLTVDNRFIECDALYEGDEKLKTDTPVKVVEIRGTTLVVKVTKAEKINSTN